MIAFTLLVLATGIERLYELRVSIKHAKIAFDQGGKEFGQGHFPWMVILHTGLLFGAVAEVWLLDRSFIPWLGWSMVVLVIASQAGRYWVIWALGWQWNTRVIVVPGAARVTRGPYRFPWLRHPNYWIVAVEGIALPLVHSAWITAIVFTALNAILLLGFRIPAENKALEQLT
jgi:methyltransferase